MSYVEKVATVFRECPNTWLDGLELARIGGAYAWRTRVSDCRKLGMTIEHKIVRTPSGVKQSLYRYVPDSLGAVSATAVDDVPCLVLTPELSHDGAIARRS